VKKVDEKMMLRGQRMTIKKRRIAFEIETIDRRIGKKIHQQEQNVI
jgi:hypothetical protein